MTTVGLLHPGSMGSRVGRALVDRGTTVLWCSAGRSDETTRRANAAGLVDAGDLGTLVTAVDAVISVCPSDVAEGVARSVSGFDGLYLEANAIAPSTARRIAAEIESGGGRYVDGGIVGGSRGSLRIYASGPRAGEVVDLFAGTTVEVRVISGHPMAASALKILGAAWQKGLSALLLDVRALAVAEGVDEALLAEWAETDPGLAEQGRKAAQRALERGARWSSEMVEIAASFRDHGLPGEFHDGARRIYGGAGADPRAEIDDESVARVIATLLAVSGDGGVATAVPRGSRDQSA